jgi:hypothetical protein
LVEGLSDDRRGCDRGVDSKIAKRIAHSAESIGLNKRLFIELVIWIWKL